MLDLFSGSGNVGNYFSTRGFEVYSIDSDPKCQATEIIDIMDWSYTKFPPNYFLVIAAGVPCTEYSAAKTKGGRNTENADAIVRRTLQII